MRQKNAWGTQWMVIVALLITLVGCERGVDLSLRAEPGSSRRFESTINMNLTMDILGTSMVIRQSGDSSVLYTVDSIGGDGQYQITGVYEALNMDHSGGMDGLDFFAEVMEEIQAYSPKPEAAIGKEFTFELWPDGAVRNMQGNTEIIRAMVADLDGRLRAQTLIEMRQNLETSMGDAAMASQIEASLFCSPGRRIQEGEQWTKELDSLLGLPIPTTITYTLRERRGNIAYVEYSYRLSGRLRDLGIPIPIGSGYSGEISGQGSGVKEVDEHTGWVESDNAHATVRLDMTISEQGMSLSLPMDMEFNVRSQSRPG